MMFFQGSDQSQNAIWSAGHQSLATISNLSLQDMICCVIDSSENKQRFFTPASGLLVESPDVLLSKNIKKILLAGAGYNQEILDLIRAKYGSGIDLALLNHGRINYVNS